MSRVLACTLSALALTLLAAPSALAQPAPGATVVILPPQPEAPVMPYPQAPQAVYPYAPQGGYPYPYVPALPPEVPPQRESTFSMKIAAGPAYSRIFGSSVIGAEGSMWFGTTRGWYGGFDVLFGRMNQGLFTWAARPGASWEGKVGIVHLGLGLNLTMIGVARATQGSPMYGFGAGVSGFGSVDLLHDDNNTLFLGLKMRAELLSGSDGGGNTPVMWGPSALIGWRYR